MYHNHRFLWFTCSNKLKACFKISSYQKENSFLGNNQTKNDNFHVIFFLYFLLFNNEKKKNRAVKFTSKLFGRALSRRIKATVLYATETGRSEQYAKQLVELLGHAFNAQVSWNCFLIYSDTKQLCISDIFHGRI